MSSTTHRRAPCPACNRGPRDRALSITTDERGTVSYCHRCGFVDSDLIERRPHHVVSRAVVAIEPLEWSTKAQAIWDGTQPLHGTVGEIYLRMRGCADPPRDSHLRFLPASNAYPPSLCAAITDANSGKPLSLHFTRLAADGRGKAGAEFDKMLLRGHRKKGGVIRLWPDECVATGLGIAEGIESALAAAHLSTPVWACIDAGNLRSFPVLPGIEALTVFADHDDVGLAAARECAERWRAARCAVRVRYPRAQGRDVADLAREAIDVGDT